MEDSRNAKTYFKQEWRRQLARIGIMMLLQITFTASVQSQELGRFPHLNLIDGTNDYFWFSEGEFIGVCNNDGKEIIPAKYSGVYYAGSNRFILTDYSTSVRRQFLFNEFGKCLLEFPDWFSLQYQHFHEGILTVSSAADVNVAYINLSGKYILPAGLFHFGRDFSEGFAAVEEKQKDGICNCGYVDHRGIMRFGPFHDSVCDSFFGKRAAIRSYPGNKIGLLNLQGKLELPQEYDGLKYQNETQILAEKNGQNFMLTLNPSAPLTIEPYTNPGKAADIRISTDFRIDKEQFESLINLFSDDRNCPRPASPEIYRARNREEVFLYLQNQFGFIGISKSLLQRKLGNGREILDKTMQLPSTDSRYALSYNLATGRHGGQSLWFSIDANGHIDGWSIQPQPPNSKLLWHTRNIQ